MKHIAMLHHLDHGSGRLVGMRHLEHGLMEIIVELLAKRADPPDPVPLHRGLDFGPAHLEAGNQRVHRFPDRFVIGSRRGIDGARQIVDRADQIAGESSMAVFAGGLHLALGAATHILDIGKRAKKLVFQRIAFGDQRFEGIIIDNVIALDRVTGFGQRSGVPGYRFARRCGLRCRRRGLVTPGVHMHIPVGSGVCRHILFVFSHHPSFISVGTCQTFRPLRSVI